MIKTQGVVHFSIPTTYLAVSKDSYGVIEGPHAYFEDPVGNTLEILAMTHYAGAMAS